MPKKVMARPMIRLAAMYKSACKAWPSFKSLMFSWEKETSILLLLKANRVLRKCRAIANEFLS
jgi:hypothetical protein